MKPAPDIQTDDLTAVTTLLTNRIAANCHTFGTQFPNYGTGYTYVLNDNVNWLAAFWPGILWQCATQDSPNAAVCQNTAERLLASFRRRLAKQVHITHDLGFLYNLSARAQWQVTGNEDARDLALLAADLLQQRYRLPGRYIQAWGPVGDADEGGRIIADTMMNLPLLFWASEQTGDPRFHEAAYRHAQASQAHLMRPDGSSYHTFFFDQETGAPDHAETHQGFGDESLWARGQAWMIYGFAIAAQWCADASFLTTAVQASERFLAELPPDNVPYWDLRLPDEEPHLRDSSAGAVAACGLLRLAELTGEARYRAQAQTLVDALLARCLERDPAGQGLLKHGALHIPKGWAPDDYLIFGDYFFLEALLTLAGTAVDFWGPTV
ncbi:MAG: glycoside hydrolase family 88 protein [Anaerolineales bacterium]|nr:glycoside hydrolase family 88 protein [Anaerolineales bacterium]